MSQRQSNIGTPTNPIPRDEPLPIARSMFLDLWRTPSQGSRLWAGRYKDLLVLNPRKQLWEWQDLDWLDGMIWNWMDDKRVREGDGTSGIIKHLKVTQQKVRAVSDCLMKAVIPTLEHSVPFMTEKGKPAVDQEFGTKHYITLRDVIVCPAATAARGDWWIEPRSEEWVEPCVLPVTWDEVRNAPEPKRWLQALDEWGNGDPAWGGLLERMLAYGLMPTRKYERWFLWYGQKRGGKGTIEKWLSWLVGRNHIWSMSLDEMSDTFALDGIQHARWMMVGEVSRLDKRDANKTARVLKNVVGGDDVRVRVMYQRPGSQRIGAVPVLMANEIPRLPDVQQGVSSKMVLLPFQVSFLQREDYDLLDKLKMETAGIVRRLLMAAAELERETSPKKKWVEPEAAMEDRTRYLLENNPADYFLRARFHRDPDGFLASSVIWNEFQAWKKANKLNKLEVARNQVTIWVRENSTWDLIPKKRKAAGHDHPVPGLIGLRIRSQRDDHSDHV